MSRVRCLLALVVLPAALPVAAAEKGFTLEQVMSSPFPSDLKAAPAGGSVAWVFDQKGVRNVWVATPREYKGRAVTSFTEDDGQAIYELQWTPDGRQLVYVRGGDEEGGGENPNPKSVAKGVKQEIWIVPAEKGPPRLLGEGRGPKVSPKGDRMIFLRQGQIWCSSLDRGAKPERLFQARGECGVPRWSPDGSKLAFVSNRRDHSFVGIYDLGTSRITWLDPSVDRDLEPVWSPDGRQVAFLRVPAARREDVFGPRRTGRPWSIRVADAGTGRGHEAFRAEPGTGSVFRSLDAEASIAWAAGDRLIFPWEKDGWTHLYSVPAGGGSSVLLTPGQFEVEHASLSPDRSRMVFSSNQNDVDRRHLWSVAPEGGPPQALTEGKGIEWSPVTASDGKAVAFLRSDARRPARPAIRLAADDIRDLAADAIPPDFPSESLVEPEPVRITAADGMVIHGQLFRPPSSAGEHPPAALFFHGGSRRQMLLGWHYMYYYHNAYAMNQYMASRGYLVLSVNYRSGIGYGMEFREALNYGATGASEFNDVLGAGLYVRDRAGADPKRIGLWGGSYGGYLTALGLSRASDLFAAGVDIHGVYDWNIVVRHFDPSYDPQKLQDLARVAYESSPIAAVKNWRSPVLVIHGDDDRNVPFSETVHLVQDLRRQKVDVEQLVFPDEIHDFLTHARWLQAQHATADFFVRHLKR